MAPTARLLMTLLLCVAVASVCGFRGVSVPVARRGHTTIVRMGEKQRPAYTDKVRGIGGFKVLATLAVLGQLRSQFSSVELRTTTVCPSGLNAERTQRTFESNDPSYHCLPLAELARRFLTDPLVLPGDAAYDPQFIRIEMRGLKQSSKLTRGDGTPLQL